MYSDKMSEWNLVASELRRTDLLALLLLFLAALCVRIRLRLLGVLLVVVSVIIYVAGRRFTSETSTSS